jgi:molybdopterin converting factor small subunit
MHSNQKFPATNAPTVQDACSANAGAQSSGIRVELTGPLRRSAGVTHTDVPLENQITLGDLLNRLQELHPATSAQLSPGTAAAGQSPAWPAGLLALRNQQLLPADPKYVLMAGESITLMPMISGG